MNRSPLQGTQKGANQAVRPGSGRLDIAVAQGSNQREMRAYNERLVLTLIRNAGPLAKAKIARLTGLSAQAVSIIMRQLEADGLLQKEAPVRGKIGQPSIPMRLAPKGAYFIGLKVGRRSLDVILTDFLGHIEARIHSRYAYPTPALVVDITKDAIAQFFNRLSPAQRIRVAGLGIALPFRLWEWGATLGDGAADMAAWKSSDIAAEIGADWDFPVYLQNDASAACGAELVFGTAQRPKDFLYFFIGYFIGGGLVLDNRLYTGPSDNAAALGSMQVSLSGEKQQQLVEMASLGTLEKMLKAQGKDAGDIWEEPKNWSISQVVLRDWMDKTAAGIAHAIAASACLIDFKMVLIDGWMPVSVREELVQRTAAKLDNTNIAGIDLPTVAAGSIGSDARALGAASLPLSERFLLHRIAF